MAALLNDGVLQLTDQVNLTHWNVHGAHFTAYHELFDAIYAPVQEWTDTAAEGGRHDALDDRSIRAADRSRDAASRMAA